MDEVIKLCPFCGDVMMLLKGDGGLLGFTHTQEATNGGQCLLRHTYYPAELLAVWNTRIKDQSHG